MSVASWRDSCQLVRAVARKRRCASAAVSLCTHTVLHYCPSERTSPQQKNNNSCSVSSHLVTFGRCACSSLVSTAVAPSAHSRASRCTRQSFCVCTRDLCRNNLCSLEALISLVAPVTCGRVKDLLRTILQLLLGSENKFGAGNTIAQHMFLHWHIPKTTRINVLTEQCYRKSLHA